MWLTCGGSNNLTIEWWNEEVMQKVKSKTKVLVNVLRADVKFWKKDVNKDLGSKRGRVNVAYVLEIRLIANWELWKKDE